jgi:hypothetical protein
MLGKALGNLAGNTKRKSNYNLPDEVTTLSICVIVAIFLLTI